MDVDPSEPTYVKWREDIAVYLRTLALVKLPYDKKGVVSIFWNSVLNRIGYLRSTVFHAEWKVWCTESCMLAYDQLTGLPIYSKMCRQALPSPIHAERLVWSGDLVLVGGRDYGLHSEIMANQHI